MIFKTKKQQEPSRNDIIMGMALIIFSGIGMATTAVEGSKYGSKAIGKSVEYIGKKVGQLNKKGSEAIQDIKDRVKAKKEAKQTNINE